jgi:hypothetical protein
MSGLEVWSDDIDGDGERGWTTWYDEETGSDDPIAYLEENNNSKQGA